KNNTVIRPLLFATREEITDFAMKNKIAYREDSSNESDDYLRNRIRHHVIPAFRAINPKFENIMAANMSHFTFAAGLLRKEINIYKRKLLKKEKHFSGLSLKDLKKVDDAEQLLFEMISPFGFNFTQCIEILDETTSTRSGKIFLTSDFRAVRDRD